MRSRGWRAITVQRLRVFGSAARREERPESDLDLLVSLDRGRTLLDQIALEQELEAVVGRKVQVAMDTGVHALIRERVFSEAVAL
jgi:hypothetical protein